MRIDGVWHLCDDGAVRPVLVGEVETRSGESTEVRFQVDTDADRTILSSNTFAALGLPALENVDLISGIGGPAPSVLVQTQIRFQGPEGKATLSGEFAAVTELEPLEMSLLGRDIPDLFSLLIDRPNNLVVFFGQQHQCMIERRTAD